jgi:lysophospholipase L1-like esterase
MTKKRRLCIHAALAVCLYGGAHDAFAQGNGSDRRWVGTWATAVVERAATSPARPADTTGSAAPAPPSLTDRTLRQIVHMSVGGDAVRVVFSNVYGKTPLLVGAAHVALRDRNETIIAGAARALTFAGNVGTKIPAGAVMMSDAASLTVPALSDLAIDVYVLGDPAPSPSPLTVHNGARQTNYISTPGNHTGAAALPVATTTTSWFFLSRVEVSSPSAATAVVTLGDSITDGYNSTPDHNSRWPDYLASRLADPQGGIAMGVLNVGIDGNRVLGDGLGVNALARFDRDVLAQTGATHLIILQGINDIGLARGEPRATADELIAGHRQLIARARARGLKVYGVTLLPFEGTTIPNYFTPQGEATRQAVNAWMRTSREYDAVIDCDAALRDPEQPTKLLPAYDSGDHLHPSDAGYKAMAAAIDLALFKAARPVNGQAMASPVPERATFIQTRFPSGTITDAAREATVSGGHCTRISPMKPSGSSRLPAMKSPLMSLTHR